MPPAECADGGIMERREASWGWHAPLALGGHGEALCFKLGRFANPCGAKLLMVSRLTPESTFASTVWREGSYDDLFRRSDRWISALS